MKIRPFKPNDRKAIIRLTKGAFPQSYLYKVCTKKQADDIFIHWAKELLKDPKSKTFVAYQSEVVGFISISPFKKYWRVALLIVDERYRGQGIGTALVRETQKHTRALFVKTQKDSVGAKTYEKAGFELIIYNAIYKWGKL